MPGNDTVRYAILLALDMATGLIIVGGAWWIFSIMQTRTPIKSAPRNTPDGMSGATQDDATAQSAGVQPISYADLASIASDPFPNSSNFAVL